MTKAKILFGLAAMALIQLGGGQLLTILGADQFLHWIVQYVLLAFVGALTGGLIARHDFVLPALTLWFIIWAGIIYLLYRIAAPAGQHSVLSILQYNAVAIVLSGGVTVVGAMLGQMLAARYSRKLTAAT